MPTRMYSRRPLAGLHRHGITRQLIRDRYMAAGFTVETLSINGSVRYGLSQVFVRRPSLKTCVFHVSAHGEVV